MDIKIKSRADVGMPQKYADCLIVTSSFYTPGRETMTQPMEFQWRDSDFSYQFLIVIPVCPRLCRTRAVCQYEIRGIYNLTQGLDHSQQFFGHSNFPDRIRRLRCIDKKFSMPLSIINKIDPLYGLFHNDNSSYDIQIFPFQST